MDEVPFTKIGKTGKEYLKINFRHSNSNFKMAADSINYNSLAKLGRDIPFGESLQYRYVKP